MRLAADANVLLSAVIGGRARLVFTSAQVDEILTTEHTFAELQEYAPILAEKKRLSLKTVLLSVASLPVTVVPQHKYSKSLPSARKRIGKRDPDDVDLLALALQLGIPIWSNDKDFEVAGVELYTSARLLQDLSL